MFSIMERTLLLSIVLLVSTFRHLQAEARYPNDPGWKSGKLSRSVTRVDTIQPSADSGAVTLSRNIYYTADAEKSLAATGVVYTQSLVRVPASDIQLGLIGLVPGLQIGQNSGNPGIEDIRMSLRGRTPVVVIDGVPRNITTLDLESIESVTVLKDAPSTAMLGARGANGAILITTKKGSLRKQQITLSAQTSVQKPLQNLYSQPLHAADYARLYNEAQSNDDRYLLAPRPVAYTPEAIESYRSQSDPVLYPNVNWRDEVLKNSSRFDRYTFTAEGGNKLARYFVSADHFNQRGLFRTSDLNSYNTNNDFRSFSIRSNVDISITPKLEGGISLYGRLLTGNSPGNNNTSAIYSSILSTPNNAYPVFNSDGSLGGTQQYTNNILGQAMRAGYSMNNKRDIITDLYLKRNLDDVLPGLWVKGRATFTSHVSENNVRNKSFAVYQQNISGDRVTYARFGVDGTQANSNNVDNQYRMDYQELSLGYEKTIGDKHNLGLLVLANRDNAVLGANLPLTYTGISGRVNYDFNNKYLAEIAFGLNGSNRFPDNGSTKYSLFPSLGLGWIVSKEEFLKDASWLSFLKLSASYGLTGWDNASYFAYITRYGLSTNAVFGTSAGSLTTLKEFAIGNSNIDYEKTAKLNIGLQTAFLNNRLAYRVDYYRDKTTGALIQGGRNSTILGQVHPLRNLGKYNYSGVEMELTWRDAVSSALNYYVSANIAVQNSKVVDIEEAYYPYEWMNRTGLRIGQRFGYIAEGLFENEADIVGKPTVEGYVPQPGDIKYKDLNGDNIINQFDMGPIGKQKPPVFAGISAGIKYLDFDFNLLGQLELNREISFSGNGYYEFQNGGLGQAYRHHLNRWTPENAAAAEYPRLSIGNNINNHVQSSYWLKNGNFFRLRNVELGYTVPVSVSSKIRISSVRLFVSLTNPFTITSKQLNGVNPEVYSGQYPLQRLNTVGINIKL
jgi:TonB-linked SusC/RagA family outer membrane protein